MQGRGIEIAQTLIDRRLVKRRNRRAGRKRHVQPAGEISYQPGVLQHMAQIEAGLIVARQGGTALKKRTIGYTVYSMTSWVTWGKRGVNTVAKDNNGDVL